VNLKLNPKDAMQLGQELFKADRLEDALSAFSAAAETEPENYEAAFHTAFTLSALKRYHAALPWYDRAAAIWMTQGNLLTLNRAQILGEMGRNEEAISMMNGFLVRQPNHAHAHYNRGVLRMQMDDFEGGLEDFERSLALDPATANGDAKFCRGFANLVLGNYLDGFRDFEHRLKDNIYAKAGPAQGEELRPEHDVSGKTILVLSVMGRGDVIQFGRFLPMLVERGANVLVTADRGTEQLFSAIPGVTVFAETDVLPASDYWCHMMGLAHAFQITVDSVPPPLPMAYDPGLLAAWRERIPARTFNVGLCWAGSPTSRYDEHRSIPLEMLRPLTDLAGDIRFYGLQQDIRPADQAASASLPIRHIGREFKDFRQTAHALKCLDLVVTVDTSVAHMAGTVGVPTWILTTRFRTYWLWLKGRNDTPWYPSVELIRQPVHGNWPSAIAVVRERLRRIT
jgi:tetratricopeptide (TPR) repeat protein